MRTAYIFFYIFQRLSILTVAVHWLGWYWCGTITEKLCQYGGCRWPAPLCRQAICSHSIQCIRWISPNRSRGCIKLGIFVIIQNAIVCWSQLLDQTRDLWLADKIHQKNQEVFFYMLHSTLLQVMTWGWTRDNISNYDDCSSGCIYQSACFKGLKGHPSDSPNLVGQGNPLSQSEVSSTPNVQF